MRLILLLVIASIFLTMMSYSHHSSASSTNADGMKKESASETIPGRTATVETCAVEPHASRVLGDHYFIPSRLVAFPFVTTHFGMTTGGGIAKWRAVGLNTSGQIVSQKMSMASFTEEFALAVRFFEFLGVRLHGGVGVLSGIDANSAINIGAIVTPIYGGSLLGRIWSNDLIYISLAAEVEILTGKHIQPLNMIEIDENGDLQFDRSKLLMDFTTWYAGPVLMTAIAPVHFFSMQTSFSFDFGEIKIDETSAEYNHFKWGIGLNLDLRGLLLPVAIPVSYQIDVDLLGIHETEHRVEGGLFYSGREHVNIGVNFSTKLKSDEQEYQGQIQLFYYW